MLIQRETCLGGKWHTFINYHILFLPRKLESHSKEQKLEANSKEKEEWKRINLPLKPSCKAGKNILVFGFNVACSRECALFVKGWYKAIVWSQSLLLTNAVAACCLDTSVYFCLRKLMLRSELKWLTWSFTQPMLLACKNPCKSSNADEYAPLWPWNHSSKKYSCQEKYRQAGVRQHAVTRLKPDADSRFCAV